MLRRDTKLMTQDYSGPYYGEIVAELRITMLRGHLRIAKQHDFAAQPCYPFRAHHL